MMYAQIPASTEAEIGALLVGIAALLGIANLLVILWRNLKGGPTQISPQPLSVRAATEFVTKDQCDAAHRQITERAAATEEQLAELRRERKEDNKLLHEKVNGIGREVSELKSATELQNEHLNRMDVKLDQIKNGRH